MTSDRAYLALSLVLLDVVLIGMAITYLVEVVHSRKRLKALRYRPRNK